MTSLVASKDPADFPLNLAYRQITHEIVETEDCVQHLSSITYSSSKIFIGNAPLYRLKLESRETYLQDLYYLRERIKPLLLGRFPHIESRPISIPLGSEEGKSELQKKDLLLIRKENAPILKRAIIRLYEEMNKVIEDISQTKRTKSFLYTHLYLLKMKNREAFILSLVKKVACLKFGSAKDAPFEEDPEAPQPTDIEQPPLANAGSISMEEND